MSAKKTSNDSWDNLPVMYRRRPEFYEKSKGLNYSHLPAHDVIVPRQKFSLRSHVAKNRAYIFLGVCVLLTLAMLFWNPPKDKIQKNKAQTGSLGHVSMSVGTSRADLTLLSPAKPELGFGACVVLSGDGVKPVSAAVDASSEAGGADDASQTVQVVWGYSNATPAEGAQDGFVPLPGGNMSCAPPGSKEQRFVGLGRDLAALVPPTAVRLMAHVTWGTKTALLWRPLGGDGRNKKDTNHE